MGFGQILDFVKQNLPFMPDWFPRIFWNLVAAIVLAKLLRIFFRTVSDAEIARPVRALYFATTSLLQSFLTGAARAIESPIERPRTRLALKAFSLLHSYLACVCFLSVAILLSAIPFFAGFPSSGWGGLIYYGVIFLLFYFCIFFRIESDRDWLALKEQWVIYKAKSRRTKNRIKKQY